MSLKAGEKVAAAVECRDYVLVFGNKGSVIRCGFGCQDDQFKFERLADIGYK